MTAWLDRPGRVWLVLWAVVFVVYGGSLSVGFFLDDVHNLERAVHACFSPSALASAFTLFDPSSVQVWCLDTPVVQFFRPLFMLSLGVDHLVFGTWPAGFHVTNLVIHGLNATLVLVLARRLGMELRTSLLAACLFAASPHNTVAVIWISGRTEVLASAFVLGSLVLYVRWLQQGSRLSGALALVAAVLGLLAKESAVVIAPLILLLEVAAWRGKLPAWGDAQPRRPALIQSAARLAPFAIAVGAYLVFRFAFFGNGATPPMPYYVSPSHDGFAGWLGIKTVYYYFAWLTSFPVMPVAPAAFLRDHPLVLAVIALLTLAGWGALAYRLRGRPLFWGLLAATAACQLPFLPVMASNHYLYLGNAAVAGILALLFRSGDGIRSLRRIGLGAAAVASVLHAAYGIVSYRQMSADNEAIAAAIDEALPGLRDRPAHLYLVNTPFLASHVGQRLRLLHGVEDLRTHILTVSDRPFEPGEPPRIRWSDARTMHLHLPNGLVSSDLVEMFLLMGVSAEPGLAHRSGPATITPHGPSLREVERLAVVFDEAGQTSGAHVVLFERDAAGETRVRPVVPDTAVSEPPLTALEAPGIEAVPSRGKE